MKVYNAGDYADLTPGLAQSLWRYRKQRDFRAAEYVAAKTKLLANYLGQHNLASTVIGVSGGIDSAVALALLTRCRATIGSPLRNIYPILMPVHNRGATHQAEATRRGIELCRALEIEPLEIDLTSAHETIARGVASAIGVESEPWAEGQLASYVRTPALYFATALTTQMMAPGVTVGTTNRDEGSYLGYVGKASDGMVDIQLISDLHKSEVYQLASYLELPSAVIEAVPSGDMYDGRVDTEVFGTSYDFVELFLGLKEVGDNWEKLGANNWNEQDLTRYAILGKRLEKLHSYNRHKYLVGSPSVHLCLYPSNTPQGWQVEKLTDQPPAPASKANFVAYSPNEIAPQPDPLNRPEVSKLAYLPASDAREEEILSVNTLLTENELESMLSQFNPAHWQPVGKDGILKNYTPEKDTIGSWRQTFYSEKLAGLIWERLRSHLNYLESIEPETNIDATESTIWRAVGINPAFRAIRYGQNESLVAHYDAPHRFGNGLTTLRSVVIYLTSSESSDGGKTRFLKDPQMALPASDRDYSDRAEVARDSEVALSIVPKAGGAICFPHRLLHDSEPITGGSEKIILRTDVVYQAIN